MGVHAMSKLLYAGVAAAACLAVAGGGAFWYASVKNAQATRGKTFDQTITITATSCEPNAITVAGGKRSFEIINASDRPIEWEILDGVMVLAERENIAPGFRASLDAQLSPGTYQMACGLLSNPRGTLTVTPSQEASAAASEVTLRKFLGPLSEYRVYLALQGAQAVKTAQALQAAIVAGDVQGAQQAWLAARLPYRRIEPLAYRFSDLENRVDPRAAYLAGREADAAFTGYHRIEYGLFAKNSTDGLVPVADALVADLTELKARLTQTKLDPALLMALPADMATQLAQSHIPAGDDPYAQVDLTEFAASLEGIAKLAGLLQTVTAPVDPDLSNQIKVAMDQATAGLGALKQGGTYPKYDTISTDQRQKLSDDLTALAAPLLKLPDVIGLQ